MALRVRAAEREQLLGVRQGFDALGDEAHAKLLRQLHDGAAEAQPWSGVPIRATNDLSSFSASTG